MARGGCGGRGEWRSGSLFACRVERSPAPWLAGVDRGRSFPSSGLPVPRRALTPEFKQPTGNSGNRCLLPGRSACIPLLFAIPAYCIFPSSLAKSLSFLL